MTNDRQYLEKGVTEVNNIGGPPISMLDMLPPPTRKERLQAHWKSHEDTYKLTGGWSAVAFGVVAIFYIFVAFVKATNREADRESTELASIIAVQRRLKTQHIQENIRLTKTEQSQRELDIRTINNAELSLVPKYSAVMDEVYQAEGRYDALSFQEMWVRFPKEPPEITAIRDRISSAKYNDEDNSFSAHGYLLTVVYTLSKSNALKEQDVTCYIQGHIKMPVAARCSAE